MHITRKTLYALRAAYELARHRAGDPLKAAAIARSQAIPTRFLETILHELRQGGFVTSRRGSRGGYQLAREPAALTVGEVIGFIEGPDSVTCPADADPASANGDGGLPPHDSDFVFQPLWQQVDEAIAGVLGSTTFQDLLNWEEKRAQADQPLDFVI